MSDILSSQTGPESNPGCSSCKSNGQVIKIVYGDPMPNSNVTELAQKGLIKLGGCSPTPDGVFKKFHCKKCQIDFWFVLTMCASTKVDPQKLINSKNCFKKFAVPSDIFISVIFIDLLLTCWRNYLRLYSVRPLLKWIN